MVPRGQLDADRHRDYRVLRGYVAAEPSDVLIITVSAVFIVGVLSLFFTAGDSKHNPNLDQNGTAV